MANVGLNGSKEIMRALKSMGDKVLEGSDNTAVEFGLMLTKNIKRGYQAQQSTDRVYRRGNVTHAASAPGFAPNTDTGRLANSVTFQKIGHAQVEVYTKLPYGFWLEFGTRRSRGERPLWRPERDKLAPKYVGRLKGIVEDAMNG